MYGQMTAGSWIYIGSQGIVQGTFETFGAAGEKHFGGNLAGKLIVSGGLGGMGGAQPLAATMNGACFIGVEVDPARIEKRLATGYCDHLANSLEEALQLVEAARKADRAVSVGLVGNCADVRTGNGEAKFRSGFVDRSNQRARCAQWLRAKPNVVSRCHRVAREKSGWNT